VTLDAELGEVLAKNEDQATREIAELIERQIERAHTNGLPARRDAHPKAHGCVRGEFRVEESLPPNLAQGVFVPGKAYKAWIRFSNGSGNPERDDSKGDSRGMAIKLTGVSGEKLLVADTEKFTQDFLMINHPVFIVDDPKSYLTLLERSDSKNPLRRLLAPLALGVRGALIARAITKSKIASPLETRYWSTTAYRLGRGPHQQAVKFSAKPRLAPATRIPSDPGPNFLRETMARQLAVAEAVFDFMVQPRTSASQSIERSTVEWDESDAPFYKVATLTIPKQKFSSPSQDAFGEDLSFTPWHGLPDHRPLGVVNRVRRVVYERISKRRRELNGAPLREPDGDEVFDGLR
jgi:hypothetical protein